MIEISHLKTLKVRLKEYALMRKRQSSVKLFFQMFFLRKNFHDR